MPTTLTGTDYGDACNNPFVAWIMEPDDATFARYALDRHSVSAFVPDFNNPAEQVFAASLASTRGLLPQLDATFGDGARSVVAGYLDTMVPNAFAGRDGDRHYIGMHQALLVTIVDLALFAFTQSAFMPTIGDSTAETSPAPVFGAVPGLFLLDRTLGGGAIDAAIDAATDRHRVPNDAVRHESAIYFALLMARFVWLHEWAHGHLGHLDQLGATSEVATLVELPLVGLAAQSPPIDLAVRHRIELDADLAALRLSLAVSSAGWENVPGIAAFDADTRAEPIVTGAYLMTWLFDAYGQHIAAALPTHPAPAVRLDGLQRWARSIEALHATVARADAGFAMLTERMAATPTR